MRGHTGKSEIDPNTVNWLDARAAPYWGHRFFDG